ncbi:MAG: hypothetical protein AAFQ04_00995 [Pseudomonadota bacterium]
MVNLLRNAIEAIAEDGSARRIVRMSAEESGDFVLVCVEDTGPGIKDGVELFTPFETRPGVFHANQHEIAAFFRTHSHNAPCAAVFCDGFDCIAQQVDHNLCNLNPHRAHVQLWPFGVDNLDGMLPCIRSYQPAGLIEQFPQFKRGHHIGVFSNQRTERFDDVGCLMRLLLDRAKHLLQGVHVFG